MSAKTIRVWLILVVLLTGTAVLSWYRANGQAGSQSAEQIVDLSYPQTLMDKAANHPTIPFTRQSAFAVLDHHSDGTPKTIVAAYSNGLEGAVLLLSHTSGAVSKTFETFDAGDSRPNVRLLDLDNDGRAEVLVDFLSFTGIQTTLVFRREGSVLVDMLPDATTLTNASFIDVDSDGKREVIVVDDAHPPARPDEPRSTAYSVFRLQDGRYTFDKPILEYFAFFRKKGAPVSETEEFDLLPNSTGPYLLRLTNGDALGKNRVSSARIVLNGVEVLSPDNFSQQVDFLSIPLELAAQNTLQVTLAGIPLGQVQIIIEDSTAVERERQQHNNPQ